MAPPAKVVAGSRRMGRRVPSFINCIARRSRNEVLQNHDGVQLRNRPAWTRGRMVALPTFFGLIRNALGQDFFLADFLLDDLAV